jgi:hypothetical protein
VSDWHLVQLNVGRLRAPLGDPSVREFADALDRINLMAERSPGFVWRMTAPSGHVSSYDGDERTIANMSVWTSYEHLRRHGPTPRAFSLRRRFDPTGRPAPPRRAHPPTGSAPK